MLQVITPNSFIKGSHLLKDVFVRISPKRGEIIASSGLIDLLEFKQGRTIFFTIDSSVNQVYVGSHKNMHGFKVSLRKGQGRLYSQALIRLMERILNVSITDPISIPVEAICTEFNEIPLFRLHTDRLKQCEAAPEAQNPITVYRNKAYNKRTLISLLRTYWHRSHASHHPDTRVKNLRRYQRLKEHCESQLLDLDFSIIEIKHE